MSSIRKNTLSVRQDESQLNSGHTNNDSYYIRNAEIRDHELHTKSRALKSAIKEGLDSGISSRTLDDIWKEAEDKHQENTG